MLSQVLLIDFGSIEFVSWKSKFVSTSTLEIDNFNESRGLCFPCSLDNIKPYDDVKLDSEKPLQYEWTSYANFMFKKETTNGKFLLKVMKPDLLNDKIIVCDLLPMNDCSKLDEFPSLSQYLVDSKVARYINVSNF